MKSFLCTVAMVGMITTTEAFSFSDVQEFVSTIPKDREAILARAHHHTLRASNHRELLGQKMGLPARTPYYEYMVAGSNHHLLAEGGDEEELGIGGMMGAVMGLFNGFQYQNTGFNACLGTVSGVMQSTENFGLLVQKMYMPWYWEDLVYNVEDWTATMGGTYTACESGKLFTTLSGLISLEGAMELASRAAGNIFTYMELFNVCGDVDSTSMDCGTILGKTFGNLIDYKV